MVESFAAAKTRTPLVFCDANFLIHVAVANSPKLRGILGRRATQATQANDFRKRYQANGTVFFTSPDALEEAVHTAVSAIFRKASQPNEKWKDFRVRDPRGFGAARKNALALVDELLKQLKSVGILISVPRMGSGSRKLTNAQDLTEAARNFFAAYDELDPADAFHLATAHAAGARWIATSDQGFRSVAQINIFGG